MLRETFFILKKKNTHKNLTQCIRESSKRDLGLKCCHLGNLNRRGKAHRLHLPSSPTVGTHNVVFVPYCCSQIGWMKTTQICYLIVLKARSSKWGSQSSNQDISKAGGLGKNLFSCFSASRCCLNSLVPGPLQLHS